MVVVGRLVEVTSGRLSSFALVERVDSSQNSADDDNTKKREEKASDKTSVWCQKVLALSTYTLVCTKMKTAAFALAVLGAVNGHGTSCVN